MGGGGGARYGVGWANRRFQGQRRTAQRSAQAGQLDAVRQRGALLAAQQLADAKVEDDEAAVVHEAQVPGLDVAMQHHEVGEAHVLQVAQRPRQLERELERT